MSPVLSTLNELDQIIVWDNSAEDDYGVYARYVAAERARNDVILTLDDDVILPRETVAALIAEYRPGSVVCNVPARFRSRYTDSGLVGFGGIYDRDLPDRAFDLYQRSGGDMASAEFQRTSDIVFTMLTPITFVDLPYHELSYATSEGRMWRTPGHFEEREGMRVFCRQILAA